MGGILVSTWGGLKHRRAYGVVIPLLALGVVQMIYGLSPWLALTATVAFLHGLVLPIAISHSQAIWFTHTPAELQGRVLSARVMVGQGGGPIGTLLAGWAGGIFSPGVVLAIFGAILIVACVAQLLNRQLLRVDDASIS